MTTATYTNARDLIRSRGLTCDECGFKYQPGIGGSRYTTREGWVGSRCDLCWGGLKRERHDESFMPLTITAAADLSREQRRYMQHSLPKIQQRFVDAEYPESSALARTYLKRLDTFLHYGPVPGEGYVFDPVKWRAALKAFDALAATLPVDLFPQWWWDDMPNHPR